MPSRTKKLLTRSNSIIFWLGLGILAILGPFGCSTARSVTQGVSHFQISGNTTAGALSIERIQLDFGSKGISTTVEQNSEITPVAIIKYKGLGNFMARWVLDGQVISQFSSTLNRGSILALSPPSTNQIPTFKLGLNQLRLEVIQPIVTFKQPSVSFFVVAP